MAKKNKAQARQAQRAQQERQRKEMLEREMADRRQSMMQDAALAVLLVVVYFVRGGQFDALGQIIGLATSWLIGLLVVDLYYLARRLPKPAHWIRRIGPAAGIGVVVFLLGFVALN